MLLLSFVLLSTSSIFGVMTGITSCRFVVVVVVVVCVASYFSLSSSIFLLLKQYSVVIKNSVLSS